MLRVFLFFLKKRINAWYGIAYVTLVPFSSVGFFLTPLTLPQKMLYVFFANTILLIFLYIWCQMHLKIMKKKIEKTSALCQTIFSEIDTMGIHSQYRDLSLKSERECQHCDEMIIELSAHRSYTTQFGAKPKIIHEFIGAYCPACGAPAKKPKFPHHIAGNLQTALAYVEKNADTFILHPPLNVQSARVRIHCLEEKIDREEKQIHEDKLSRDRLRQYITLEEISATPAGYRIAAVIPEESSEEEVDTTDTAQRQLIAK